MCSLEKRGSIYILTLTGNHDHRLTIPMLDYMSSTLRKLRSEVAADPSICTAFITTGEGKFFTNGGDMAWVNHDKAKLRVLLHKIRAVLTDYMMLPMPTIAAVNGHASGTGCVLALCHDYVLMNRERGFFYMAELDLGVVLAGPFLIGTLKAKISNAAGLRDFVLKADKLTAERAVEMGIIDAAYGGLKETLDAAVELGEQLVGRKWDGNVYAENREILYKDLLQDLSAPDTDEVLKRSRLMKPRM